MKIFDINIKYSKRKNLLIDNSISITNYCLIKRWNGNLGRYVKCKNRINMYNHTFIELYNNIDFYKILN